MGRLEVLLQWLADSLAPGQLVMAKRLSANDTGQTGGHQAGFYVPKSIAYRIAPSLAANEERNPRKEMRLTLVSHDEVHDSRLIRYNNRFDETVKGTRDECRITGFGGGGSAVQRPDSTGALMCLAFESTGNVATGWLAKDTDEEDAIEAAIGVVLPGEITVWASDPEGRVTIVEILPTVPCDDCRPDVSELPATWRDLFPTGAALSAEAARRARADHLGIDSRLTKRWDCETTLFAVVEEAFVLQRIVQGFETVADFTAVALSVLNRRKSRAGTALELQLQRIFYEEEIAHERGAVTEQGRRPDFLFPSASRYHEARSGSPGLRMLAVKTTLKDRWRQVLDEAAKIPRKHLFTLAEGVSWQQYEQMASHDLRLVVPARNVARFPISVRGDLLTLESFIRSLKRIEQSTDAEN